MAQDDFSGVTASLDASTYSRGQQMTLTLTGQNRHTGDPVTTQEQGSLTLLVKTESGGTLMFSIPPFTVLGTSPGVVTMENVTIAGITDPARTWTIGGDGKTATATA